MSRVQSIIKSLAKCICVLALVFSIIGAPIFIPLGAVFLWQDCNYIVSAQIMSIRTLHEYGRCQVKVAYDCYDGLERFAQIETACPTQTSQTSQTYITGCYNHYHPDKFESLNDRSKTDDSPVSHTVGIVIFSIGIAMIALVILLFTCWCYTPADDTSDLALNQPQQPNDGVAIGLPVLPVRNPIISAQLTLKRTHSV